MGILLHDLHCALRLLLTLPPLAAALAGFVLARHASRVAPTVALRFESQENALWLGPGGGAAQHRASVVFARRYRIDFRLLTE